MSVIIIAADGAPALSDKQREFIAWTQLQIGKDAADAVRASLTQQCAAFKGLSIVEEHQIRQEARKRDISLPC